MASEFTKRRIREYLRLIAEKSPVKIEVKRPPEVRIIMNSNVKMSRGKYAAQAVHAALKAAGVPHGRVVVLGGNQGDITAMDVTIRDAGRTEIEPGTLTAGASLIP